MTKLIKELIEYKPSKAIRAMIKGLKTQFSRPDFVVDMNTFGNVDHNVCFGCAATCTIQELFEFNFDESNITNRRLRSTSLGLDMKDLEEFEFAIDQLRRANLRILFIYCKRTYFLGTFDLRQFNLRPLDNSYLEHLKGYEELANFLENEGL